MWNVKRRGISTVNRFHSHGDRVALGVAGGYILGRTKKMELAMMLAGTAAGRQAGGPAALLGQGGSAALLGQGKKLLEASPELSRLALLVRT